jgi:hypothetical protein
MHLLGAGFSRGTTNQPMEVEVSEGGARRVGSEGRMSRRPPSISARCLWVPAWLVILWVDGRPDPPPCASNSRPACCASQLLIPSPSVSPCLTYGAVNTCMSLDIDHRAFPAAKGAWAAWGWWLGSIRHWRAGESPCADACRMRCRPLSNGTNLQPCAEGGKRGLTTAKFQFMDW